MRTALALAAVAAGFALSGCAQSYYALERLNHDLCARNPTGDCFDNGYVRAVAYVADPRDFLGPPPGSGDLGNPGVP